MYNLRRPAAELVITRPDGTEDRFVRRDDKGAHALSTTGEDDDGCSDLRERTLVAECAPYTASFNNLLSVTYPNENPTALVKLVYDRMMTEGIPLNTSTYNLLMKRVVYLSDGTIFALYERLKNDGLHENSSVRPNLETYRLLFRACERGAEYHRSFLLYQQMRDMFLLTPDTATYNTLLGYCAAVGDVAQASYFIVEMRDNNVTLDANTYNCLMSAMVDTAPYAEILDVFTEMVDAGVAPSNRTYTTVLKAACVHNDYDRVFLLFDEMKRAGLVPDISAYNIVLWMCEKRIDYVNATGNYQSLRRTRQQRVQGLAAVADLATTLLREMDAVNVAPNTFTFNKLLSILLACGDRRLLFVSDRMITAYGIPRDAEKLPEVALQAVPKSKRENSDLRTFALLETAMVSEDPQSEPRLTAEGVQRNVWSAILVMKGWSVLGRLKRCKAFYTTMKAEGVLINRELALIALHAAKETSNMDWGDQILSDIREQQLYVDTALLNAFVAVLGVAGEEEVLLKWFESLRRGTNEFGARADTGTYNIILRRYARTEKISEAKALFEGMRLPTSSVKPNDATYVCMIQLASDTADLAYAADILETCKRQSVRIGVTVYHALMRLYAGVNDTRIVDVFQTLRIAGEGGTAALSTVCADVECYNIMMRYYLDQRQFAKVDLLFEELQTSETLDIDATTYTIVIDMYNERGQVKSVVDAFGATKMHQIKATIPLYDAVLRVAVKEGSDMDKFVFQVLSDMKANEVVPADSTVAILASCEMGRRLLATAVTNRLFFDPEKAN